MNKAFSKLKNHKISEKLEREQEEAEAEEMIKFD